MCLVISVLLGALGANFYLNGFFMQALLMAVLSIGFMALMIRNVRCRKNECSLKKGKNKVNEPSAQDFEDHTHSDPKEAENK